MSKVDVISGFLGAGKTTLIQKLIKDVFAGKKVVLVENEFGEKFIRIHRNALVAVNYLDGLEVVHAGQYQVRCREINEKLAVSRRHLPLLRERMQKL